MKNDDNKGAREFERHFVPGQEDSPPYRHVRGPDGKIQTVIDGEIRIDASDVRVESEEEECPPTLRNS